MDKTLTLYLGITIFDITDPSTPQYCFVDFYGMESTHKAQIMSPLDAKTYMRAFDEADAFANIIKTWGQWQLVV